MSDRPRAFVISEDADDILACLSAVSSPDRQRKFGIAVEATGPGAFDGLVRMAITLHLNRRSTGAAPSPSPDPAVSPQGHANAQEDRTAQVAYGETRTSKEGKVSHYAGPCATCGKPAWISHAPWLGEGTHTCPRCYAASRGAKA
jgi:hypothetical protein